MKSISLRLISDIIHLIVNNHSVFSVSTYSGFVSMYSIRASMQSVSAKRMSTEQHRESMINSSTVLGGKSLNVANMSSIINNSVQMASTTTATTKSMMNFSNEISSSSNSMTSKMMNSAMAKKSIKNENYVQMGNYGTLSFNPESLVGHDNYAEAMLVSSKKSIEHKMLSNSTGTTFEFNEDDCIAEDDEVPPALPVKTRSRHFRKDRFSTYDNVDETDDFPK